MIRNTADFDALLETLNDFVRTRLVPHEEEVDRTGQISEGLLNEMRALGLGGLTIPERYGGAGLTVEEKIRAAFVLGWTTPAFYRRFGTNDGPAFAINVAGTDEQKKRWLPRLASGEATGSFALTEPNAGSDALSLKTVAMREGESFILNGEKRFITNAPHADVFLVMARTDKEDRSAKGVSAFLVDGAAPGLIRGRADKKMGLHGNDTADLRFENCRVPASALVGDPGDGFKLAMRRLDVVRMEAAAIAVGNAERLIDECVGWASDRQQFGEPIGSFQLVQAMLADSRAEAYAARCMVVDAAQRCDRGEITIEEAAACKLFATEMVGRVADRAVQIHGGMGYMQGTPVERFYRDVRIYRIYDGTNQIQQLVIARNMLKRHSSG
ncbi:MAG: acyl-CoA dehydrogenase family protein [Pseudomonadota bacterium]